MGNELSGSFSVYPHSPPGPLACRPCLFLMQQQLLPFQEPSVLPSGLFPLLPRCSDWLVVTWFFGQQHGLWEWVCETANTFLYLKALGWSAGGVAQQPRECATFAEDLSWVSVTYVVGVAYHHLYPQLQDTPSSGLHRHCSYVYTPTSTYT